MNLRIVIVALLFAPIVPIEQSPAQSIHWREPKITIWLMPNEPAASAAYAGATVEEMRKGIDEMRGKWGEEHTNVTMLNVTVDVLREQLLTLNHPYAMRLWPIVKGQELVFQKLDEFASREHVHVYVRILDWTDAFSVIRDFLEHPPQPEQMTQPPPDVIQIGTTWRAFFSKCLLPPNSDLVKSREWKTDGQSDRQETISFIKDLRLLYYWKRMPYDASATPELKLDAQITATWETLLKSLADQLGGQPVDSRLPPLVIPTAGDNINLIHDYAPLVWAGGGAFLRNGGNTIDLTSATAMKVPLAIQDYSQKRNGQDGTQYLVFSYLDVSPYDANVLVMHGLRGGCIAPFSFLRLFHDEFGRIYPQSLKESKPSFENCVDMAPLPCTFMGGSDLMVVKRQRTDDLREKTFRAAMFLASGDYAKHLAELGQMPPHLPGLGVSQSLSKLDGLSAGYTKHLGEVVDEAKNRARQYEPFADFPTKIEPLEICEKMRNVWRSMSDGSTPEQLTRAALEAQRAVNVKTSLIDYWWYFFVGSDVWRTIWTFLAGVGTFLVGVVGILIYLGKFVESLKALGLWESAKKVFIRLGLCRQKTPPDLPAPEPAGPGKSP